MSNPAAINRFGVVLRASDVHVRRTGRRSDAGPSLKMRRAVGELGGQFKESRKLDGAVRSNLEGFGDGE